ncbi:sugar ABC transporter permease [Glutamicibacter halophytocola]|uniref:Sugar ABC transporter permease n=1 Tax=Glutamicibacter halophytocola TaxID=1933880 RepID=A0ABX5YCN1_9MICC|nr:ABC transporter permease subunit [Glutamicibacter halophytocola]QDY67447.1 sugar ABC transporter permease [Glutamicibacter halophytocola]
MSQSKPAAPRRFAKTPAKRRVSLSLTLKKVVSAWQLYVLLVPAIAYIVIFKYWPMYGVQIAFRNYNPADGFTGSPWVGLQHFIRFVNSYQFTQVLENTVWIAVLGLLIAFPVPIILALLVNGLQSEKFKKFTQTVLYSPAFISTVVVVGMMFVLLSPRSGLINNAIQLTGGEPIFFMGSPDWFRPIYLISDIWQTAGFSMIVYLAALAGIDPALHDAAKVDGATKLQRMRHIDLPGIMPMVTVLFILAIGNLLNVGFEKALLMQTPLNLANSEIIQTYVYHAGLQQAQFSYSAAIGLFNSILNLVLLLIFNRVARRANQATLW